jgi:hypothetical protein
VLREEVIKFGLDAARDEYTRGQSRLALVETKAALISATVGILLALLATIGPKELPQATVGQAVLLIGTFLSLACSLALSISASLLSEVDSPQSAASICELCAKLIEPVADLDADVDPAKAQKLLADLSGSYVSVSEQIKGLLVDRLRRLRGAQIALLTAIIFMVVLLGPFYLGKAVAALNLIAR